MACEASQTFFDPYRTYKAVGTINRYTHISEAEVCMHTTNMKPEISYSVGTINLCIHYGCGDYTGITLEYQVKLANIYVGFSKRSIVNRFIYSDRTVIYNNNKLK